MSMGQYNRRKEDVIIAVLDERLKGLDRSFSAHEIADHDRFEIAFKHMSDFFDKMENRFDKIDTKLQTLWDQNNHSKGAFSASRLAANGIWAVVVLAASWFINRSV